ncbi:AAA family ATPase [Dyadobacter bucti]|uniref:AAA family ATPase n=1 Tax=Dyadobacter bucti TaxID=2572203 RepID=UPI003F71A316
MNFFLANSSGLARVDQKNIIVLYRNDWDDWFQYETVQNVYYYSVDGNPILLGAIKIGEKNLAPGPKSTVPVLGQRSANLPNSFSQLGSNFFSLGQDVTYYEALNNLGEDLRHEILTGLNDIALNSQIYTEALNEHVTRVSLLRSVSTTSVEGQFRRLAQGNAVLTTYNFAYISQRHIRSDFPNMALSFEVTPNSYPATNIHVIIGRNGVGKTHLFNNMISSILDGNRPDTKTGFFSNSLGETDNLFANLVSVSFSAFDENNPVAEKRDKTKFLNYSYIGLKRVEKDGEKLPPKSPVILKNEFVKSVEKVRLGVKNARWISALEMLETDPIFQEAEVVNIAKLTLEQDFKDLASKTFTKLSSGHKIVLLTITRLVETVEEKSLVILDEPEGYLHPPLLSAFLRALSDLLTKRNAVAIIGTHSPVVLQEVTRNCVWKLRRQGANAIAERPEIESFGENVGTLTQEVFGLEVTDSGFHKLLKKLAYESENYEEAIGKLNNQLGLEGRAILRNLIYQK